MGIVCGIKWMSLDCWDEFQMMFCDLGNTCTLTVAGADGGLPPRTNI
ncbi:hypothetical protein CsSME_00049622 [Camellia sinensis var. sinensis]